ncbi:adenosylcobyric acid synthase (glutamine-hydrolysing) [Actinomadura meyerae]|uniref:Cobyric acid synthase n=1 Tax=Actinomadura meyerae TaxID=240840 RepID=A0A239N9E8_9ACTN|nr:cobyric acid synthase [Actinomadura meyerae]SNT50809.1 adenosylcobyric acid synthase (glutamine-hydrolysing) [Actinomadura meyerae]
MSALLVAGTTSDAGKSVVTAGLCRWLARQGVKVAPFKAQNMSLNSMVTSDGAEIGRAQYMQAQAAGVEPRAVMNPVLLKPGSDRRSQVVVLGRPVAEVDALQYGSHKERLKQVVLESLDELRSEYDVVVCEGAGSPAEINLRAGDIVNMGLARAAGLPVVVVGDIDRGGVFASLYGTVALMEPEDQALVAGFVINKFRGAYELLEPGLEQLEALTGRPTLGVLPWKLGLYLDSEDTLALDAPRPDARGPYGRETLRVAVVRFPRISNFTDLDALACEPGVVVRYAASVGDLAEADLVVLPGTRATVNDLLWLRERGMAEEVSRRAREGLPVLGICGGYQMLAEEIVDGVESKAGIIRGLGLLPAKVEFGEEKVLGRPSGSAYGEDVRAYEIHHGVVTASGEPFLDGCRNGAVWGTTWHGAMENDGFRRALLQDVARRAGRDFTPAPDVSFAALREATLDALGDLVEEHLDTGAVWRIIEKGAPAGLPVVPPGGAPPAGGPARPGGSAGGPGRR